MSALVVLVGCALLAARPALLRAGDPGAIVTVLFAVLLVAGLTAARREQAAPMKYCALALVVGVAIFAVGRLVEGGHAPVAFSTRLVALNSLAAVAEEAFFRRLVYAVLLPSGAAVAIGGAALLFALVHLATYGAWVLPIDVAAGFLFGWQRWATNSWRVPAATHVVANLLVVV